jgi:hypothetical protein
LKAVGFTRDIGPSEGSNDMILLGRSRGRFWLREQGGDLV